MEILRGMFRKMFPRHGLGTRRVLPYSMPGLPGKNGKKNAKEKMFLPGTAITNSPFNDCDNRVEFSHFDDDGNAVIKVIKEGRESEDRHVLWFDAGRYRWEHSPGKRPETSDKPFTSTSAGASLVTRLREFFSKRSK
jgi:hypothetical protein